MSALSTLPTLARMETGLLTREWAAMVVAFALAPLMILVLAGVFASSPDPMPVEAVAAHDVGLRTKARIARDGTVLMSVQLSLPVALTRLNLSLPEVAGDQVGFNPRIRGLRIFVDGQSSQLVAGTLRTGSATTVTLRQPASVLELRYRERGTVVRTKGSTSAGRALAWLTSLSISPTGERSSTVSISGSDVLNLGCAAPGDPLTSCGHHTTAGGWRVGALPRDAEVYAQVNLPAG